MSLRATSSSTGTPRQGALRLAARKPPGTQKVPPGWRRKKALAGAIRHMAAARAGGSGSNLASISAWVSGMSRAGRSHERQRPRRLIEAEVAP
jgi:hypothetical protein